MASFGICTVPLVPLRAEASHRSEMVSQLLFGEVVEILQQHQASGFVQLRNYCDRYEGWSASNQILILQEAPPLEEPVYYTADPINEILVAGHPMQVPLGSFLSGMQRGHLQWGKLRMEYKGNSQRATEGKPDEKRIRQVAFKYLNTPYLWGGRSNFGIDCSGLSQSVFRFLGVGLPRDAHQQAELGKTVSPESARCGDLAFFANEEGRVVHVGLMLDRREIIHAAGKVRLDALEKDGIYHSDTGFRTHRFHSLKRFF